MNRWGFSGLAAITVFWACLSIGSPTTQSSKSQSLSGSTSGATTKPAPSAVIAPATKAKADSTAKSTLPSPAELIRQLKALSDKKESLPHFAYFDLSKPISEKPANFSLFAKDQGGLTFRVLIDRLEKARQDNDIRGVLITLENPGLNLSQAMELHDELNSFRKEGKRTFVFADSYETPGYIAACGASDICMLQGGGIEIPGVGFETMFAKGLLDKIGINADYVQIGEYKGADEEFTRTEPSPELAGQLNNLADSLYSQIISTISLSRNMRSEDVKLLVDDALIPGEVAKNRGLVDHLVDEDGLRDLLNDEIGQKVDLVYSYGAPHHPQVDMSSPFALFQLLAQHPDTPTRPGVAVIYADGVIIDGRSNEGLFSNSSNVGSETMRQAFRVADRDSKVAAVVIRINSPGGSALASEVMWQAARRLAKDKPVIISVGSMAASGGYYLASAGDYIYADPTAIVGSIGVVGGKFVMKDLFLKLGISNAAFLRGRNADLFSSSTEWTERQRRQVTSWMRQTYDQFTERVMTTREGKIKDIDAVARGRIFAAKDAVQLGMVDKIGGLSDAVSYAAEQGNLQPGEYDVRVLPAPRSFADIFNNGQNDGDDDGDSALPIDPKMGLGSSLLEMLPPGTRSAVEQQLQIMMLLQQRPVVLACPYTLEMR